MSMTDWIFKWEKSGLKQLAPCFILFLLVAILFFQDPLEAKTKVLAGKHVVIYDIVNPLGVEYLPDYSNNSYKQTVLAEDEFSKRVAVEIDLSRLNSSAGFPIPLYEIPHNIQEFLSSESNIQTGDGVISARARGLVGNSRYVQDAFAAVADWIIDNVTYDAGSNVRQDASSVMATKRGSCVGLTRLCIAMLRSVGIPARYAHGYLPPGYEWGMSKEYWGVKITSGGFHAWIEVYYPDVGWTFSDLEHSKNFVDPFHILRYIDGVEHNPRYYGGGELDVENATTYTIYREENTTLPIDQLPSPRKVILGRQRLTQQFGTVYGSIVDNSGKVIPKGEVVLWEGSKGRVFPFEHGRFSIVGLKGGNYRVTFKAKGYVPTKKSVSVQEREVININIRLNKQKVISSATKARRHKEGI